MSASNRAVFLDRDGVLNATTVSGGVARPPISVGEVVILPGVAEGLEMLRSLDFRLLVVTNQPDVARGRQTREAVEEINAHLHSHLPLDGIYTCYHDDSDRCACRKPRPGLIIQAAQEWKIDPRASYLIGDRGKDIEAGKRAGCRTFLLKTGCERDIAAAAHEVASLYQAAHVIAGEIRRGSEENSETVYR